MTAAILACHLALDLLRAGKNKLLTFVVLEGMSEMELQQVFRVKLSSHLYSGSGRWEEDKTASNDSQEHSAAYIAQDSSKDTLKWFLKCASLRARNFLAGARVLGSQTRKTEDREFLDDPSQTLFQNPYVVNIPNIRALYPVERRTRYFDH